MFTSLISLSLQQVENASTRRPGERRAEVLTKKLNRCPSSKKKFQEKNQNPNHCRFLKFHSGLHVPSSEARRGRENTKRVLVVRPSTPLTRRARPSALIAKHRLDITVTGSCPHDLYPLSHPNEYNQEKFFCARTVGTPLPPESERDAPSTSTQLSKRPRRRRSRRLHLHRVYCYDMRRCRRRWMRGDRSRGGGG